MKRVGIKVYTSFGIFEGNASPIMESEEEVYSHLNKLQKDSQNCINLIVIDDNNHEFMFSSQIIKESIFEFWIKDV